MNNTAYLLLMIFTMAVVTYLIRMTPMMLIKNKLRNGFVQSFVFYVPYAVLAAMVVPDIFFSTASIWSALAGFVTAVLFAFREKNLLVVALFSCLAVYICELALRLCGVIA